MQRTFWLGFALVSLGCTRSNPAFDERSSTDEEGSTRGADVTAADVTAADVTAADVTTGDAPLPLDCCTPGPSCARPEVAACVCAEVPECCSGEWTDTCVQLVDSLRCDQCGLNVESCCVLQDFAAGAPSCQIPSVMECVCTLDDFCCSPEGYWDAWCVAHAVLECHTLCDPLPGDCCVADQVPGCGDFEIVDCVCDALPDCCAVEWDLRGDCPALANECGGDC